jgi:hypothetical protein
MQEKEKKKIKGIETALLFSASPAQSSGLCADRFCPQQFVLSHFVSCSPRANEPTSPAACYFTVSSAPSISFILFFFFFSPSILSFLHSQPPSLPLDYPSTPPFFISLYNIHSMASWFSTTSPLDEQIGNAKLFLGFPCSSFILRSMHLIRVNKVVQG